MRAGIVTFTDGTNYGQRLQNLAVQKILQENGYEVETFRIRRPDHGVISLIKRSIKSVIHIKEVRQEKKREHAFKYFNNKYISFYHREIYSGMNNDEIEQRFDIVIAGSDQVWNPLSVWVTDINFLTFVQKEKRMSIAASFAVDTIPENKRELFKNYLNGIDKITLREYEGAKIIMQLCDREVPVILDPTLIVDRNYWKEIACKPELKLPDKYIVKYFLGENSYDNEINRWASIQGYKIIDLKKGTKWYYTAPDEFIYIIQHSSFVFTDSYHGSIFAILAHVQFRNYSRKGQGFSMESRFNTLYQILNIDPKSARNPAIEFDSINYEAIDHELDKRKNESIKILKNMLKS